MNDFALTADGPTVPAPGARLTDWSQMVGRTVCHVCENPQGPRGSSSHDLKAVLIFTDDCWATLFATIDGCGEDASAYVNLTDYYSSLPGPALSTFLSADEMLTAQMINHGQYELLLAQQDQEYAATKAARVARLRKEADELEKVR